MPIFTADPPEAPPAPEMVSHIPTIVSPPAGPAQPHTSDFRDGFQPRPSDIFIAVMGVTGAGKSTFISHCTQKTVKIGHDLQACTQDVTVYQCQYNASTNVYLVDTPGFDDTHRSDSQILKEIATWLTDSYSNKVKLNGIIYFHRITDLRMQGSAKRNLFMFKKLCGQDALKNVILTTTMWEKVVMSDGERREKELIDTPEFWGWMTEHGSRLFRHYNTRESAMRLIGQFMSADSHSPVDLAIQSEMVDGGKTLDETMAGRELESVLAQEREKFRRELADAQQMMKEAIEARDKESADMLRQQQEEMNRKIEKLQDDRNQLKVTMEKLHADKYAKLEKSLGEERQKNIAMMKSLESMQAAHKKQLEQAEADRKKREAADAEQRKKLEELTAKLSIKPSSPVIRTRSTPGINQVSGKVSLSLCGDNYCFIGAAQSYWRMPKEGMQAFEAKTDGQERERRFMALGASDAFYFHYHINGSCWTLRSKTFKLTYPDLNKFMDEHKQFGCPTTVSLGPNGCYFMRSEWGCAHKTPTGFPEEDFKKVKRIWWGYNNSYVIERYDGSRTWQLHGNYGKLGDYIRNGVNGSSTTIRDLAMNLEKPNSYVIVFSDGSCAYAKGDEEVIGFDNFVWEEYCSKNFGLVW